MKYWGSDRKLASDVQEGLHRGGPPEEHPKGSAGLVTGLRSAGDVHRCPDWEEERVWRVQEQRGFCMAGWGAEEERPGLWAPWGSL